MKSILLATLTLASAASAAVPSTPPSATRIAPAPEMNLYAALPPAPEPSHAMLLMIGCASLAMRRRRAM